MKYSGTKPYDQKFTHHGYRHAEKSKEYTVKHLVPGTKYTFEVYGTYTCGNSSSAVLSMETMIAGKHFLKDVISAMNGKSSPLKVEEALICCPQGPEIKACVQMPRISFASRGKGTA